MFEHPSLEALGSRLYGNLAHSRKFRFDDRLCRQHCFVRLLLLCVYCVLAASANSANRKLVAIFKFVAIELGTEYLAVLLCLRSTNMQVEPNDDKLFKNSLCDCVFNPWQIISADTWSYNSCANVKTFQAELPRHSHSNFVNKNKLLSFSLENNIRNCVCV